MQPARGGDGLHVDETRSMKMNPKERDMDVEQVTTPVMGVNEYVKLQLGGARQALAEAHALLAQRPAMVPPREHMEKALGAARNAAEHLYDVGQIDEPVEAVREALAAAEAIMVVVRRLDQNRPAMVDQRALAAEQLREVDGTLAGLEQALGLAHFAAVPE